VQARESGQVAAVVWMTAHGDARKWSNPRAKRTADAARLTCSRG
jgi:hypothetical protein